MKSSYIFVYINARIGLSDFDGRNNGFDIPRLDMAIQSITLSRYFSFPTKRTLSLPISHCILAFSHVYNKKCSLLLVVYIWSYEKHLNYYHDIFDWLLCVYWSIFSADSFWQVGRPGGWATSFLFVVDCPSESHTIYSIIDSFSGVTFFLKVIHNHWFFHLWDQNVDPFSKLFSLGLN